MINSILQMLYLIMDIAKVIMEHVITANASGE